MTAHKNAGGCNPPAAILGQLLSYRELAPASRANPLEQAAEVLCLLAFFPVTETARTVLLALLERRMKRAYAGGRG